MIEILLILFSTCLIVQVFFYLGIFSRLISHDDQKTSTVENSVSVIVAARNEALHLPQLIKSLQAQDHQRMEVIIVNDRSEDNSSEIISGLTNDLSNFQLIDLAEKPEKWNGKKYALLKGIEAAKHDILIFTDADCIPRSAKWTSSIAKKFDKQTDIVLGFSPYQKTSDFLNLFIRFETLFVGMQYLGMALIGRPYMGVGRNLAIRRSKYDLKFLEQIAGVTGGDDDLMVNHLSEKANTRIATCPDSQTISIPKQSWRDFFRQKIRHLSVGKHYRKKDKTLLGLFTLTFLFGWIFFFLLLVSAFNPYLILAGFGLRSLSFYIIFARIGRKLDVPMTLWALPVLDLCYCIYYPIIGFRALTANKVSWK